MHFAPYGVVIGCYDVIVGVVSSGRQETPQTHSQHLSPQRHGRVGKYGVVQRPIQMTPLSSPVFWPDEHKGATTLTCSLPPYPYYTVRSQPMAVLLSKGGRGSWPL